MNLTNAIYITSLRRYTTYGGLSGKWYNVEDFTDFDDLLEQLTEDGFDLDGFDEELTALDLNLDSDYLSDVLDSSMNNVQSLFETIQAFELFDEETQQELAVIAHDEGIKARTAKHIQELANTADSGEYIFHHGKNVSDVVLDYIFGKYGSDADYGDFDFEYIERTKLNLHEELGLLFEIN